MKKNEKLITGIAVGAVAALFMIPKTRKLISDAMCSLTGSLKNMMQKTDHAIADS